VLELFLNTPTLALAALTLVVPWRWVWRFWLLVSIAAIALLSFSPRDPDPGVGYVYGLAILFSYGLVFASLLAIRFGIQVFISSKSRGQKQLSGVEKPFLAMFEGLLCAFAGIVAAGFAIWALAYAFSAIPGGYVIHGVVGLLSLAGVIVLAWRLFRGRLPNWRAGTFAAAFSSLMIAVSVYGPLHPEIVLAEAERVARDAPFCIALGERHRPARSRQDLTFFTMDKNGIRHHAILLVDRAGEREGYHWSYRQRRFVEGLADDAVACLPRQDFAAGLLHWKGVERHGYELNFGGRDLVIPTDYNPNFTDKYLSISAPPPDFKPIERSSSSPQASAEIGSRAWLEGSARDVLKEQSTGRFADLMEVREGPHGFDWFYKLDTEGQISTLILCTERRPAGRTCQHRFYRDGAMYTFDHSLELLAFSSEMEDRLFALFSSFDTSSTARR